MPEENTTPTKPNLKTIGRGISLAIIIGAVVVAIIAIWEYGHRPETDDATVRANFIGVAHKPAGTSSSYV